jgi:hypothetical protein
MLKQANLSVRDLTFTVSPLSLEASWLNRRRGEWQTDGKPDPRVYSQRLWLLALLLAHFHTSAGINVHAQKLS